MKLNNRGISLLEIVVVFGLLALVLAVLFQLNFSFLKNVSSGKFSLPAKAIAAETLEALRFSKEESWSNLSNLSLETDYYLNFSTSTNKWLILTVDPGKINDIFSRKFILHQVSRDASGKIVSNGGAVDSRTFLVEARVSWQEQNQPKEIKLSTYLADF